MTTNDDELSRPDERAPDFESPVGFSWACPLCGESGVTGMDGDEGAKYATAALRTHINASDGADHGPQYEYPEGFELVQLDQYVVAADTSGAGSTASDD